ncbi:hypothetical protein NUU61_007881 [Penicillium alfredii]|uniref:Up-regulated during septation protein 1 domain-containing protein n=1 Tax=Penicillium alfredii TaxID=1506179 RepID=A0A9W9ERN0_9EURO|nr:uncharacterized protein NUU61_007881 [Penicillium alfredii]KAJ5086574.1 hypothetical protein NUU61_007881 [Penicillium alfredii]
MNISLRSSQSSYGDPRYLSTVTASDGPSPLSKTLVDGYRDALDPQPEDRSRFNPANHILFVIQLNPSHPRSSALLNANDPVTMYLLTETAMGDSMHYEVLSFEEVEELKKERTVLSGRIEGTKRKLTLETKLRDAAQSIGRLYSPPSPRSSGEFGANDTSKSHRRSRSIFGRNGTAEALDRSDSELAVSQRRCEELAQELWKLERRTQQINQRLLEHTAGVLQMTHKGLKKAAKNPGPRASTNLYDGHDFDDRSLYQASDHLGDFGVSDKGDVNRQPVNVEVLQTTERRLEELNERMRNMMIQSNPDEFVDLPPQSSADGGPVNSTAMVEAHMAYLENGLNALGSRPLANEGPAVGAGAGAARDPESEDAWRHHLTEINNRVQSIVDRFGLTRSPTLPPPPDASQGEGLEEQLSYLQTGVDGLESRVDGLLEQKSILTTQIQQQRELNSKSDAERDAHITDLTEQLANMRKDLEVSGREGKANQDELSQVMEQLDSMRHNGTSQEEARAALVQAEGEVARLQSVVESLHSEVDARAEEVREARDRADQEVAQLEATLQEVRNESDARVKEALDQRSQAEENANRVQGEMTELEGEIVRVTTELTMVKAELDGAYGTRAQRAAEVASNPEIQKEIDALNTRNIELTEELATLRGQQGNQQRADTLEKELRETLDDYEAMTKASIEFEKERERFESVIDKLRDRCEQLETQLSEERISWMNLSSPTSVGRDGTSETTSTMVLKNEFKKMMRDTRNENMKILKQEERRRLEGVLRALRKEHANVTGKPIPSPIGTPL